MQSQDVEQQSKRAPEPCPRNPVDDAINAGLCAVRAIGWCVRSPLSRWPKRIRPLATRPAVASTWKSLGFKWLPLSMACIFGVARCGSRIAPRDRLDL
jgi:hypothetical protein